MHSAQPAVSATLRLVSTKARVHVLMARRAGAGATLMLLAVVVALVANQSMGAVLAVIGLHDADRGGASTGLAFVGGFVLLIAGFCYAFA